MPHAHLQVVTTSAIAYLLVGLFPRGTHSMMHPPPITRKSFSLAHFADTPLNTPSPGVWTQDTHACPPGFLQTGTGIGCRRGAHPLHLQRKGHLFQFQKPARTRPYAKNKVQLPQTLRDMFSKCRFFRGRFFRWRLFSGRFFMCRFFGVDSLGVCSSVIGSLGVCSLGVCDSEPVMGWVV
jgi:hypothetical protein